MLENIMCDLFLNQIHFGNSSVASVCFVISSLTSDKHFDGTTVNTGGGFSLSTFFFVFVVRSATKNISDFSTRDTAECYSGYFSLTQ